jgi:site-specific DNA-methyltransferase (cytosine-N4-specific)
VPCIVLDPFAGSGTVGVVAQDLSRRSVLIDLNPQYLKLQMERNVQTPLGLSG